MVRMWNWVLLFVLLLAAVPVVRAVSIDQAMPGASSGARGPGAAVGNGGATGGQIPAANSAERQRFQQGLHLDEFRLMAIEPLDQVKIIDSWAREALSTIHHRPSIDGEDAVYTIMDMMIRPEAWEDKNFIYVPAPLVSVMEGFVEGPEKERIHKDGMVSPALLNREDVQRVLDQMSQNTKNTKVVSQLWQAYITFQQLQSGFLVNPPPKGAANIAPTTAPPTAPAAQGKMLVTHWHHPVQLVANLPDATEKGKKIMAARDLPPLVPQYSLEVSRRSTDALDQIWDGWIKGDAAMVNKGMAGMQTLAESMDPENYPSMTKAHHRSLVQPHVLWNDRQCVFVFHCDDDVFDGGGGGHGEPEIPAGGDGDFHGVGGAASGIHGEVKILAVAAVAHADEFESVLGAALLGCLMGWGLEMYTKKGLFGMAFAFVGFLANDRVCGAALYVWQGLWAGRLRKPPAFCRPTGSTFTSTSSSPVMG